MQHGSRPVSESLPFADERLARLVTAGSRPAFSTLYERYHDLIYRYCRSILLHEADAHDAVQSTFTRVFEALQRGQRDAPLRPWLFRIAHNESISMLRRRKVARALHSEVDPRSIPTDDRVEHREQVGLLLDDLRELPARQRGAIVMRELAGLSHEEIAAALRVSVSGARQAIFEARGALNDFAAGRAMSCADVRREISHGDRRVLRRRSIGAHLRDCPACTAFVASLPAHRAGLRALAAPLAAGPARLLARLFGSAPNGSSSAGAWRSELFGGAMTNVGAGILAVKHIAAVAIAVSALAGTGAVVDRVSGGRPVKRTSPSVHSATVISAPLRPFVVPRTTKDRVRSGTARGVGGSGRSIRLLGRAMSLGAAAGGTRRARRPGPTRPGQASPPAALPSPTAATSVGNGGRGNVENAGSGHPGAGTSSPAGRSAAPAGNGNSGSPPGRTKGHGGRGNSGSPPGHAKGHGNSATPPGHAKGHGNSGTPPGHAKGHGNSATPPGHAKGHAGRGRSGSPPGHAKGHGGHGNSRPSHGHG